MKKIFTIITVMLGQSVITANAEIANININHLDFNSSIQDVDAWQTGNEIYSFAALDSNYSFYGDYSASPRNTARVTVDIGSTEFGYGFVGGYSTEPTNTRNFSIVTNSALEIKSGKFVANSSTEPSDFILMAGGASNIYLERLLEDYTTTASAKNNELTVSGGDFEKVRFSGGYSYVKAGYTQSSRGYQRLFNTFTAVSSVQNNSVNISGGNFKDTQIYGGSLFVDIDRFRMSDNNNDVYTTVTNNTVTITKNPIFSNGNASYSGSSIFGGIESHTVIMGNSRFNVFSGNTLNFSANPIVVNQVGNFEHYNFGLTSYNKHVINTDTALLAVTDGLINHAYTINSAMDEFYDDLHSYKVENQSNYYNMPGIKPVSYITLKGIDADVPIHNNDEIILLQVNNPDWDAVTTQWTNGDTTFKEQLNISEFFATPEQNKINIGLTETAVVDYVIDDENNKVTAVISGLKDRDMRELDPLLDGRLALLMNVVRGNDLASSDIFTRLDKHEDGDITPFAVIQGSYNRYNTGTGSHIKSNDYTAIMGGSYQLEGFTLALFSEYGHSDYNSYRPQQSGDGNTKHYGLGFIGKYTNGNGYMQASIQYGRSKMNYHSKHIAAGASTASFDSNVNYLSGHLGWGYFIDWNDANRTETSMKYLYSHIGRDNVKIAGDHVMFEKLQSSRIQAKEQWYFKANKYIDIITGIGYEHEFCTESAGWIKGKRIAIGDVKNGTGIIEFGLNTSPFGSDVDKYIDFRIKGYVGRREAIAGVINLNYTF